MIYSVWNQTARRFDYYETSESASTVNADSPKHLRQAKLGLTPTQASWPLPVGARRVGSGALARGRVAHPSGGALSGIDMDPSLVKAGLLVVSAFLVWKYVAKKR